jgi:hypothetical protein
MATNFFWSPQKANLWHFFEKPSLNMPPFFTNRKRSLLPSNNGGTNNVVITDVDVLTFRWQPNPFDHLILWQPKLFDRFKRGACDMFLEILHQKPLTRVFQKNDMAPFLVVTNIAMHQMVTKFHIVGWQPNFCSRNKKGACHKFLERHPQGLSKKMPQASLLRQPIF